MKQKEPRVYTHCRGLFWDYRRDETTWNNKYFDDEPWHIKEYWNVFIRLNGKFWEYYDSYYDGHTVRAWTLLGVCVGYGYSYESKSVARWEKEAAEEVC